MKQSDRYCWICILFILFITGLTPVQPAWSQPVQTVQLTDQLQIQIRHFTYVYGFPVEDVRSVTEGSDGRLWLIASKADGVVFQRKNLVPYELWRYDGSAFISFGTPASPIPGSGGDSEVSEKLTLNLARAWSNDSLLIEAPSACYYFDIGDASFHRLKSTSGEQVFDATAMYKGVLFLATMKDSVVRIWKESAEGIDRLMDIPRHGRNMAFHVNDSDLWIGFDDNGIFRYNLEGELIRKYDSYVSGSTTFHSDRMSFFVMRQVGDVITISSNHYGPGILRYSFDGDHFSAIEGLEGPHEGGLHVQDPLGNHLYFFGTHKNYHQLRFELASGVEISLDRVIEALPGVQSCYSSNLGDHLWVASEQGLHLVQIKAGRHDICLKGVSCRAISRADTSGILVGSDQRGAIYHVPLPFDAEQVTTVLDGGFTFNRGLFNDANGYWANNSRELVHFTPSFATDKRIELALHRPEAIAQLSNKAVAVGNVYGNLEVLSYEEGRSMVVFSEPADNPLSGRRIHCIEPLDRDLIAVGTSEGLFAVHLDDPSAELISESNKETFLSVTKHDKMLYAGTLSGELWEIDLSGSSLGVSHMYDIGAPVATITPDTAGRLWLGTFNGVVGLHIGSGQIHRIPGTELADPESNRHSAYFDIRTNTLCVGSVDGLTLIDLDLTGQRTLTHPPSVLINSITYFSNTENTLVIQPISDQTDLKVTVPAEQPYLHLTFHMDDLTNAEGHTYQYRLTSWGGQWFDLGKETELTFHNLEPGRYNVEIRGQHSQGIASGNTAQLSLHVKGFFYESTWFYIAVGFLVSLLGFLWFRRNIRARRILEREVAIRTKELRADKDTIEEQARKLRELDGLKSRFFANISHELRTPLTLILSPLKEAMAKVKLNPELRGHLKMATENARTLETRVAELLALSKLEHGMLQVNPVDTDLVRFLRTATSHFHSLMSQKKISFRFENALGPHWQTRLDRPKLEKIIYNLLGNAVKFTAAGGTITLRLSAVAEGISIELADTGRGIPKEDLPQIFERYFQTNRPDTPPEGGTGIGLALVKELTELQGGEVWVESTVGEGTTFHLVFPFQRVMHDHQPRDQGTIQDIPAVPVAVPTRQQDPSVDDRASILVVEDHPDLRLHITQLLDSEYRIVQAPDGAEALRMLREKDPPDLILSDVMMPEMDGFELLREVKRMEGINGLPFCFLTAKAGMDDKIAALRLGVDDYILKPFNKDELLARIRNLLNNAKARRAFAPGSVEAQIPSNESDAVLARIQERTLENLDNPRFSIEFLSEESGMSRRSLHRFILGKTGLTPNNYIKDLRLTKARWLLEKREVTSIAELSTRVGFQTTKYFSRLFKERFGKSPSDYM